MRFRNLFSFKGRIGRLEYFLWEMVVFFLPLLCMLGGVALLLKCIGVDSFLRIKVIYPLVFVVGILLCMIWSGLALGVRRLHDLGRSGWWIFSCFVTEVFVLLFFRVVGDTWGWSAYGHIAEKFSFGVGVLFSIYLLFFKGTVGPNRYGDDPLEKHSKTKT